MIIHVVQNIPRGENGHHAAKHVEMVTQRGFDLALHIVTVLNQVIYGATESVTLATVSN